MTLTPEIGTIWTTPRPCAGCGVEFLPPKRADRIVLIYCSTACERKAGLRRTIRVADRSDEERLVRVRRPRKRVGPDQRFGPKSRPGVTRSRFASRLIAQRVRLGLTQDQLAEALGMSTRAVEVWEEDRADPGVRPLAAMAALFGMSMDALWNGEEA